MTVSPAAGPLTCSGDPPIHPPTMPRRSPRSSRRERAHPKRLRSRGTTGAPPGNHQRCGQVVLGDLAEPVNAGRYALLHALPTRRFSVLQELLLNSSMTVDFWGIHPTTATGTLRKAVRPRRFKFTEHHCSAGRAWPLRTKVGGQPRPVNRTGRAHIECKCLRGPVSGAANLSFQNEDRDLSCRLGLVFRVGRKGLNGPLPPLVALGPLEFASRERGDLVAVLQRHRRVRLDVGVPRGMLGAPPWDATMT